MLALWLFVSVFTTPMCFWAMNRMGKLETENKRLQAVLHVAMEREMQWRSGVVPPMSPQGRPAT